MVQTILLGLGALCWLSLFTGIGACAVLWLTRNRDRTWPSHGAVKTGITLVKFFTGAWAVFSKTVDQTIEFVAASGLLAALAFLFWELAGLLADRSTRASLQRISVLQRRFDDLVGLLDSLDDFVKDKRASIAKAVKLKKDPAMKAGDTKMRLQVIRDTLNPDGMIAELLRGMAETLKAADTSRNLGFRVCLYVDRDGYMVEYDSFDSIARDACSIKSYKDPKHKERYCLANMKNPSVMVQSIRERKLRIIPDCSKVPGFHFTETQKAVQKSLISHPFWPAIDPKNPLTAAIVIDTNVVGYFSESKRDFLEQCLLEFTSRIELEFLYRELLEL